MKNISECEPGLPPSAPPRIVKNRKITGDDAKNIARLVATRRLTEVECCHMLNINPKIWFNWKGLRRNLPDFNETITRIRATKIDSLLSDIEDIGDGIGMKQKDWRAKQFVLQVTDARFITTNPPPATESTVQPLLTDALRRAFAGPVIDIDTTTRVDTRVNELNDLKSNPSAISDAAKRVIPPRKRPLDNHPQQ